MSIEQIGGKLHLDNLTLEKHAAGYPPEMREAFIWFGCFFREACMRDLEVLVSRCKELGINHDKTTWSKILRGRWNKDANDNIVDSPTLALPKFLSYVEKLKDDERVREMAGRLPFVETSTAQTIWNFIDVRRAPERVNKFGIIVAYTGSQTTASFKEYQRRHNHGLCTWQEAPENGSMSEFVVTLAVKYGGSWSDSRENARQRVFRTVKSSNVIIVDNAQTLYRPKHGTDQPVFNLLRRLQDERGCTIILKITKEFHQKLVSQMLQGYFEQFEGRAGGRRNFLQLDEFAPGEDVLAFAQAFKLKDSERHLEYLVKISREPGRIRSLLEDLQTAKTIAESEKRQLTIGHVKAVRDEET